MNRFITFDTMYSQGKDLYLPIDKITITLLGEYLWYTYKAFKNNNVSFYVDKKNEKVSAMANKDIKKGEELLVRYGYKYWLNYYLKKHKEHIFNTRQAEKIINNIPNIIKNKPELCADYVRKRLQSDEKSLKLFNEFMNLFIDTDFLKI